MLMLTSVAEISKSMLKAVFLLSELPAELVQKLVEYCVK